MVRLASPPRGWPAAAEAEAAPRLRFRPPECQSAQTKWPDWPLRGPRAAQWCIQHVLAFDASFLGWHSRWVSEQKLDPLHPNVTTHESCCRALDAFLACDQLNLLELAGAEVVARQLQLAEERERQSSEANKTKNDNGIWSWTPISTWAEVIIAETCAFVKSSTPGSPPSFSLNRRCLKSAARLARSGPCRSLSSGLLATWARLALVGVLWPGCARA